MGTFLYEDFVPFGNDIANSLAADIAKKEFLKEIVSSIFYWKR
jgi:hypothetical protein